MKKVKFYASTRYVGCGTEEIFEFGDNVTDFEIENEFGDWMWENIESYWEEVE